MPVCPGQGPRRAWLPTGRDRSSAHDRSHDEELSMVRDLATSAREPVAGVLSAQPGAAKSATAGEATVNAAALHHIVIVGGGAGGLVLATKLGRRLARRGKA